MEAVLIDDETVVAHLDATLAIQAIEDALREYGVGSLCAPARVRASLGEGAMVFTVAGFQGGYGFRAYDTFRGSRDDQVTLAWGRDGALEGVVFGPELGRRRTGALGAAAGLRLLPRDRELSVGVIGAGAQAYSQLWALSSVLRLGEIRCFRRDLEASAAFASRVLSSLEVRTRTVAHPWEASQGVDLLIVATGSSTPVVEESWVSEGTTIFTLGPKSRDASELPHSLYQRASLLVTDSPSQIESEGEGSMVSGRVVIPLAELAPYGSEMPGYLSATNTRLDSASAASAEGVKIYLSEGLAGTEVFVAKALIARLRERA